MLIVFYLFGGALIGIFCGLTIAYLLRKDGAREFENLANRVFDAKLHAFTTQSSVNLHNILSPLSERIKDFEHKIADVYINEAKERFSLKEQINQLATLNHRLNTEAQNLTAALQGNSKTRGNWGEMVLESILNQAGLVKDREYKLQQLHTNNDGKRFYPDVVVNLPNNRVIIIDAKVSLIDYSKYSAFTSSNDVDDILESGNADHIISGITSNQPKGSPRQHIHLTAHIKSLRTHIKELSSKQYQSLYTGNASLDFVMLFIPIEAALSVALEADLGLLEEALKQNVVLVTPNTLIATLRTIATIWRHEYSFNNANEIAKLGGVIYDQLCGFLTSFDKIEVNLKKALQSYKEASSELKNNDASIIFNANELKQLGSVVNKNIPAKWQQ